MGEHLTSCMLFESNKSYLQLNTEVGIHISPFDHPTYWVYMLKDSRDLFILKLTREHLNGRFTGRWQYKVLILHHSAEDTEDQYCYIFKYLHDGNTKESGTVRCAPVGLSREDANNYSYTSSDFFLNSDYYSMEHKVSVKLFKV